jgi:hypothetical protein
MSVAQANYTIKSIGIIVNTKLKQQFDQKKQVTSFPPFIDSFIDLID